MARITIPYAVADFVEMRERDFYYVDKTDFIPDLDRGAPIRTCFCTGGFPSRWTI